MFTQERERPASRPRCPWCHEEGDPTGRGWVVCLRDHTPAHAACIEEFRICPICRGQLEVRDVRESALVPPVPVHRETDAIAPAPAARHAVEPLPAAVLETTRALRALERRRVRDTEGRLGGLATAIVFGLVVALLHEHLAFAGFALVACAAGLANAVLGKRPRALTPAERQLLEQEQVFAGAAQDADRVEAELADLDRERSQVYRQALERRAPIEDAQRVRGIGPWTTARLREAGIVTLYELLRRDPTEIKGIKKKRASALREWARDRQEGIDRLLESPDFPRAEVELEVQSWRVSREDRSAVAPRVTER